MPDLALAGIYCPGCGMLRATHDLAHGDVMGALQRNPLAPLVLAALVAIYAVWVVSRWTGRPVALDPWALDPLAAGRRLRRVHGGARTCRLDLALTRLREAVAGVERQTGRIR